jgi:hypothetical protein
MSKSKCQIVRAYPVTVISGLMGVGRKPQCSDDHPGFWYANAFCIYPPHDP